MTLSAVSSKKGQSNLFSSPPRRLRPNSLDVFPPCAFAGTGGELRTLPSEDRAQVDGDRTGRLVDSRPALMQPRPETEPHIERRPKVLVLLVRDLFPRCLGHRCTVAATAGRSRHRPGAPGKSGSHPRRHQGARPERLPRPEARQGARRHRRADEPGLRGDADGISKARKAA